MTRLEEAELALAYCEGRLAAHEAAGRREVAVWWRGRIRDLKNWLAYPGNRGVPRDKLAFVIDIEDGYVD